MTAPQPKTKAEELVDQLRSLTLAERRDELLLRRLKNDAKKALPADPFHAHTALGILTFFENDIAESCRYFEAAILVRPNSHLPYYNYAVTLSRAGYFEEASIHAAKSFELDPGNQNVATFSIRTHLLAGKISTAINFLNETEKYKLQGLNKDEAALYSSIITFLQENNMSEPELSTLLQSTASVLHENNIFHTEPSIDLLEDEESKWVTFEFMIDKTSKEVAELDFQLAMKLAEIEPVPQASRFVTLLFSSWRE